LRARLALVHALRLMFSGNTGLSGNAIHSAIFFNFVSLDMSAASFALNYLSDSHADHHFWLPWWPVMKNF
jgi:hypothetical protein